MRTTSAATLVLVLACTLAATARAKPPTLDTLFPSGGRRGETVAVTAAGSFAHWPVKVWTEGKGLEVSALPAAGKLSIAVASTAEVGVHWIRLYDEEGATALRAFLVGTLPEVVEAEPNDDPTRPQRLVAPAVTVNGKLGRNGDVDGFSVPLRKGEVLVAALEANRRIGSPMDGLLQVVSADGFVLAQNDDAPDRDPMIVFHAPGDGSFLVRAFAFPAEPDSRIGFSGGDAFIYRLTLTTRGFLDHAYPLAMTRGSPGRVEVAGWNIDEAARSIAFEPADDEDPDRVVIDHPLLANAGEVRLETHPTTVEVEPNPPKQPQEIAIPVTITGRIDPPGDEDVYQFTAKKGQPCLIRVESRSLGQPLDPVLRVLDASGKVLSEVDDTGRRRTATRDPDLTFTPPDDATFRIVVRDLNGQGSFRHVYRLTAAAPAPEWTLTLASDQFTLTPGTPLKIPVTITRDNGFNDTVELEAIGLPDDVDAPHASSSPSGPTAKTVTLEWKTTRAPWSGPFRIFGRVAGGDARPRAASASLTRTNGSTEHFWLTILAARPSEKKAAPAEVSKGAGR